VAVPPRPPRPEGWDPRTAEWAARPIADRRSACHLGRVSRTEILLWIVALFLLEVNHLKWIWWEHWNCRACTAKHKDCACGATARWMMFL
jgi:hypothetical protein